MSDPNPRTPGVVSGTIDREAALAALQGLTPRRVSQAMHKHCKELADGGVTCPNMATIFSPSWWTLGSQGGLYLALCTGHAALLARDLTAEIERAGG